MKKQYSFVTNWELRASLKEVWDAIYNSLEWPNWWRGVHEVIEIKKNDACGVNGVRKYTWKSFLPYQLSFTMRLTENEYLKRIKGLASGELEGMGEWFFSENNGIVHVRYNWNIVTTKKWMNNLSFLLKPVFQYTHDEYFDMLE